MKFISKRLAISALAATGFLASGVALAADQPTYGTALINGSYSEWDLTEDFFANMYEAGNPDKALLSKAYLRYDCNSKTMFALVLDQDLPDGNIRDDGKWPAMEGENAWIKIRSIQNSNMVDLTDAYNNGGTPSGNPPESAWVPPDGIEGETLEGYEASFPLNPGTYNIEIHVNMNEGGDTSSTGKSENEIQVSVQCDEPAVPSIDIEKSTNSQDADEATGPTISVGDTVTWEYVVTNTGNVLLSNVSVEDDKLGAITCPQYTLAVGEDMTCTATGTAVLGQYANEGTATGEYEGTIVDDQDPSHYLGVDAFVANPLIDIEKSTNGQDADIATGPSILTDQVIDWEYVVTNIGNVPLSNVSVEDDKLGAITCPQTTLALYESMTCDASGTATAGQYANLGTATGVYEGTTVNATDPSHYFGADPAVDIEKHTQGFDADTATGPFIALGDTVYWLYSVKNTGNVNLTDVTVIDDQDAVLDCGGGSGDNIIESLLVGETKTCQALGTATLDQYANLGTANSTYTDDEGTERPVSDEDPSHYFGAEPGIDIEKCTTGAALSECMLSDPANHDSAPGAFFVEGDPVFWTYTVTNTGNVLLENVVVSDDQGIAVFCDQNTLEVDESMTCTATGFAMLGQYVNEGTASGDVTVYVGDDQTAETRTAEDMDPSHYYGVDTFQPSLEVSVTAFDVSGEFNEFLNGAFLLENASNDPTVTAIGVQSVDFTIVYRLKADKGNKWTDVNVNDTCTTDPSVPFVFEGDGDWDGAGDVGQQTVTFDCTAEAGEIPADYTVIRTTVCVEIFNRYDRKTGDPTEFCSSSDMDEE